MENSYAGISSDLKTTPASDIEIHIYAKRWRYIKATKNWNASGNIEGVSKLHFIAGAINETGSSKVAVHEFTHAVILKLLVDQEPQPLDGKAFDKKFSNFPTWLWEAISVYEANQFVDPKTLPYLNNNQYPTIAELNNRYKGGKIYTCGYTIIEYLLTTYQQDKFIALIKNYGSLQNTLGVSDDTFCKEWYQFVKEKYLQ